MNVTKQIVIFLTILLLMTTIISPPEIHKSIRLVTLYYCIPLHSEDIEQHSHPVEVEVVSISEPAGTYYGEAICAEWVLPDELSDEALV